MQESTAVALTAAQDSSSESKTFGPTQPTQRRSDALSFASVAPLSSSAVRPFAVQSGPAPDELAARNCAPTNARRSQIDSRTDAEQTGTQADTHTHKRAALVVLRPTRATSAAQQQQHSDFAAPECVARKAPQLGARSLARSEARRFDYAASICSAACRIGARNTHTHTHSSQADAQHQPPPPPPQQCARPKDLRSLPRAHASNYRKTSAHNESPRECCAPYAKHLARNRCKCDRRAPICCVMARRVLRPLVRPSVRPTVSSAPLRNSSSRATRAARTRCATRHSQADIARDDCLVRASEQAANLRAR